MKSIFIDISDIILYARNNDVVSGIQRVILSTAKSICKNKPEGTRVYFSFYHEPLGGYVCCPADFILEMGRPNLNYIIKKIGITKKKSFVSPQPSQFAKYKNNPIKLMFHKCRLAVGKRLGNERILIKYGMSLDNLHEKKKLPENIQAEKTQLVTDVVQAGDALLMMDANWNNFKATEAIPQICQLGVTPYVMVHDLIPLTKPMFFKQEASNLIYRWLKKTTEYCTHYISVSQSTKRDLARVLDDLGHKATIKAAPLARHISDTDVEPTGSKERIDYYQRLNRNVTKATKMPYVLAVGTREIRKNNWGLAQAWQKLSQDPDVCPPKLVFAGKSGWLNDDFNNWMKASGNLNGLIEIIEQPSEEELDYLYQNCEFTAYPSFYEGWGLPVGESIHYGKTAIVADNSSLPEVGLDLVEYCQANDTNSIYIAAKKLICDTKHRQSLEEKIQNTAMRSWDDVANDVIAMMLNNEPGENS